MITHLFCNAPFENNDFPVEFSLAGKKEGEQGEQVISTCTFSLPVSQSIPKSKTDM